LTPASVPPTNLAPASSQFVVLVLSVMASPESPGWKSGVWPVVTGVPVLDVNWVSLLSEKRSQRRK
jgi:hypothetical protein